MTNTENEILELIRLNPNISTYEISEMLSISTAAINRSLRSLKQKQYIKRNDSKEKDKWLILK